MTASERHESRTICPKCSRGSAKPTPTSGTLPRRFPEGREGTFPFPGSGPSAAAAGPRRCLWCWGGDRAVRSRASPSRGLQALLRLLDSLFFSLSQQQQQQQIPSVLIFLPARCNSCFCRNCCFYRHSQVITQPRPEDSRGFSTPEQPVPFPPATAFHIQCLFNNLYTF